MFSLPAVCFTTALPSMCSIGMVTPSTYTLRMAVSSSTETADSDQEPGDKYAAVRRAAGPGRRMSDTGPWTSVPGSRARRRLSVCHQATEQSTE